MNDEFAVFILTHGRPSRVTTLRTLERQGYTGKVYLIVDDEDATLDEYKSRYGEQVIVFDKKAEARKLDQGDNFSDRRTVIFARNASMRIMREMGIRYALQLDDDYSQFVHKFTAGMVYRERPVKNLDKLFAIALNYYKSAPALTTIAFGQNGDFIGGRHSSLAKVLRPKRKAMNTFFVAADRPFKFIGRVNEDVNSYVRLGNTGSIFLTLFSAAIIQADTQSNAGGMTEQYVSFGTYVKSFYTIMYCPSCVQISVIGYLYRRIHHRITWADAVPCILHERHRKSETRSSIGSSNHDTPIPA